MGCNMDDKREDDSYFYFHTPCCDHPELLEKYRVVKILGGEHQELVLDPITFEEYMQNAKLFIPDIFVAYMRKNFTEQYAQHEKEREICTSEVKKFMARFC